MFESFNDCEYLEFVVLPLMCGVDPIAICNRGIVVDRLPW
jgi:hypothetical protein